MTPKITIRLDARSQQVLEGVASFTPRMLEAVRQTMDVQNELTVGHIAERRMTGRGPFPVEEHRLGVRTNRLRLSLRPAKAIVVTVGGNSVVVSDIGTNVAYAGTHEMGYSGPVQVPQHTRTITTAFGKKLEKPVEVQVRQHTRQLDMPARAPIQHGIMDRAARYGEAIGQAAVAAWGKDAT